LAAAYAAAQVLATRLGPGGQAAPAEKLYSLGIPGYIVASLLERPAQCILVVMAFFTIILILRLIVRRDDVAAVLATLACTLAAFPLVFSGSGMASVAVVSLAWGVCLGFLGLRFGLLAAFVGAYIFQVLDLIPWTTHFSDWYSGRMWTALAALAVLLAYGVVTALGGRSILKDPMTEQARAG
jgi:hypothetical protein